MTSQMDGPQSVLLKVSDLTVWFGGLAAISGVNLSVKRGSIQGLIGPNGAGKTTLFNVVSGIVKPTSGKIVFDGELCTGLLPFRLCERGISRTFQNIRILEDMTVTENVQLGMHCRMKSGFKDAVFRSSLLREEEERTRRDSLRLLEFTGLTRHKDNLAGNLAYGLQRRLEIARALATDPKLLMLDEPSSGMNTGERESLSRLILSINEDLATTILLIEHDMKLAMRLSDSIVVLNEGKSIAEGRPEQIQRDARVIEAYLGKGYKRGKANA